VSQTSPEPSQRGAQRTPRRRWPRFSLRSLLVFTALIAALLAWVGNERQASCREQQIALRIAAHGGSVTYATPYSVWRGIGIEQPWWRTYFSSEFGARIALVELRVDGRLDWSAVTIMKQDFADYRGQLWMNVSGREVIDLQPIRGLGRLRVLSVSNTSIQDLAPLAGHDDLRYLMLGSKSIRDLTPLHGLKKLRSVRLYETSVSSLQIEELQRALPECRVAVDSGK
jgi:hypothetical protein